MTSTDFVAPESHAKAARSPHGTTSVWMGTAALSHPEPLADDHTADVCIVGAGIAGLTTAYLLIREGRKVIVLDDGPIAGGETARTTAHLSNVLDCRYVALERLHGADRTPLIAESHARAIDRIESIVTRERIACDFRRVDGYLFAGDGDEPADLERERGAALRAGLSVEWVPRAPLLPFDTGRCLRFPNQAQFHPLRYLAGLATAVRREGGRIFGTHATRFVGAPRGLVETTSGHTIAASDVVVATNSPVNDLITMHTKQGAYRTYVVAGRVPAGRIPPALYWDTAEPYHYVRLQPEDDAHDLLIVGGEDHHTGQADDATARYERLEEWARARFATFGSIAYRWSGQIIESIDGIAFIGRNPGDSQHVYISTGDSGNGMTHGTIAGLLIADLIAGRPNRWAALYDPARITPGAALEFTKENLHVAAGYARWIALGLRKSVDAIPPGCGAVVQRGLRTIAAYRDEHGTLHERSAVCPHLGGRVVWNEGEQSWDCPCHGSRFDAFGRVINGPANTDLGETS